MTREELNAEIAKRVAPRLEELGIEGFIMAGYVVDGQGMMSRFACGQTNKNPAIEDGLGSLCLAVSVWAGRQPDPSPAKNIATQAPQPEQPGGSS